MQYTHLADLYNEKHPIGGDQSLQLELSVGDGAKVALFHNKPFEADLSWLEYHSDERHLKMIMENGNIKSFPNPVPIHFSVQIENAHQVLMVLVDDFSGEPVAGGYFPLVVRRKTEQTERSQ